MPDPENPPVASPAAAEPLAQNVGPSAEEVLAAAHARAEQERLRAERMAQENEILRQQAQMAWTSRQPPGQPAEDPTNSIFNNAITDPAAAAQGLRSYVSSAMQQAAQEAEKRAEARAAQMVEQTRSQMMIQNAFDNYPELRDPKRAPQFIGEVAKVKAIYEAQGIRQPEAVYLAKAAEAFRQPNRPVPGNTAPPAYVEGGGTGAMAGNPATPAPIVPQQNPLEKVYKMPAGSIIDPPSGDEVFEEVKKFVTAENAEREKHQVMPAYSEVMVRE